MNGWDRNPQYEPDFGWAGRLFAIVLVMVALLLGFGWMLV